MTETRVSSVPTSLPACSQRGRVMGQVVIKVGGSNINYFQVEVKGSWCVSLQLPLLPLRGPGQPYFTDGVL